MKKLKQLWLLFIDFLTGLRGCRCEQCLCHPDDFDMVILPNTLWLSIASADEFICAQCIELRLERKLDESDFPDALVAVYAGQRLNVRLIPVNLWFFARRHMFGVSHPTELTVSVTR